jgi:VanZ family protein
MKTLSATGPAKVRSGWFRRACRASAWLLVVVLAFYSLAPPSLKEATGGEPGTPGQLNHALAYFVTAVALRWAYPRSNPLYIALCLVAYGCILELLQNLVPERTPRVIDAVSSGLGGIIGAALGASLLRVLTRQVDHLREVSHSGTHRN